MFPFPGLELLAVFVYLTESPRRPLPSLTPAVTMPYEAQISRTNPACILILIDQSRSMDEPFAGTVQADQPAQTKAAVVADAVNRLLQNLVLRSAKADGVRDYFHVGVIGYGKTIEAGLGGKVPFEVLIPISQLADHPLRVETRTKLTPDGSGGVVEQTVRFPVWFEPVANGQTPMCEAIAAAALAVKGFADAHPTAYPPIVLNLTDGRPSDGNPIDNTRSLRKVKTADGHTIFFNLLLSSGPSVPVYFISDEGLLSDVYSRLLFRMSSPLPPRMWDAARSEGFEVAPGGRGVVFNADPTAVVRFLDIGTRVAPAPGR